MNLNVDSFDDLKIFFPKYLSEEQQNKLFDELKSFPDNIDKRFYSASLSGKQVVFQGDGFKNVKLANYEQQSFREVKGFLVRFDCIFSLPSSKEFIEKLTSERIFTLINYGFYLLLFKLSVHFTRIQEKVDRDSGTIM